MKTDDSNPRPRSQKETPIIRFYSLVAPLYGIWSAATEERASLRSLELAKLQPAESVLEVAVGGGKLFSRLAARAGTADCVGIDLSPGMLRTAQHRLLRSGNFRGALCRANALQLPFPAAAFDVLFNCYMLDLIAEADIPQALAEFGRVLKTSGRLILLCMAKQPEPLNSIWMWLYRRSPLLVGGCRPFPVSQPLQAGGWKIEMREMISQFGFRSELIIARPSALGEMK